MKHAKYGIAAWPRDENWLTDGDTVALHGHLTLSDCYDVIEDEADLPGLVIGDGVLQHVYARTLPERGGSLRVEWPYPPGRGAYPVTIVEIVDADKAAP